MGYDAMTGQGLRFQAGYGIITRAETFAGPGNFLFPGFNFIGYRANRTRFSLTQARNENSQLAKVSATLVKLGGSYLFDTHQKQKTTGRYSRWVFRKTSRLVDRPNNYTAIFCGSQLLMEPTVREKISFTQRLKVYQKTNGICSYCGEPIAARGFRVDHVIPVVQGGSSDLSNLTPACRSCNGRKGAKTPEEFKRFIVNRAVTALADYMFWANIMDDSEDVEALKDVICLAINKIEKMPPTFYIDTLEPGESEL